VIFGSECSLEYKPIPFCSVTCLCNVEDGSSERVNVMRYRCLLSLL